MAFRQNNNRRQGGGNFDNRGNYGGGGNMRGVNPWNDNMGRGGGNEAIAFANNLLTNLLRNQSNVPSLLDMDSYNNPRNNYDNYDLFGPMGNRGGRNNNRNNNRNNSGRSNNKGRINKPNAVARSKNILAKNSNNSKSDSTDKTTKNDDVSNVDQLEKGGKRKNSPYADVPNDMFYCHLCTKHMWDSTSFENHLKGRTHQMMKEGVEESYRLRANMLRQEAKISEQLKSIEIDRLKRLGKAIRAANQNREYCTMCDLHFYGHLSTHRKSDGHLDLKKFLHPKCDDCTTEFHNRTEYDDHLLSPAHMKTSKTPPSYKSDESKRNRLQILTEADEVQGLREDKPKKDKKDIKKKEGEEKEKKLDENGEPMETEESGEPKEGEEPEKEGEEAEEPEVPEQPEVEPILDFTEGQEIGADIESKIPKYNCKRSVGTSLIGKLTCFECRLCNKYFDNDNTSEIHSRTFNHHRLFVKFLNEKANETKIAQKRAAAAALEETERLKRQKLESEAENGEGSADAEKAAGGELYDPSDATGDDEKEANGDSMEVSSEANGKPENGNATTEVKTEETGDDAPKEEEDKPSSETDKPAAKKVGNQNNANRGRRSGRYGGRY